MCRRRFPATGSPFPYATHNPSVRACGPASFPFRSRAFLRKRRAAPRRKFRAYGRGERRPLSTGGKWTERPPGGHCTKGEMPPGTPRSRSQRTVFAAPQPRVCRGALLFLRGSFAPSCFPPREPRNGDIPAGFSSPRPVFPFLLPETTKFNIFPLTCRKKAHIIRW